MTETIHLILYIKSLDKQLSSCPVPRQDGLGLRIEASEQEALDLIRSVDTTKATGLDGIGPNYSMRLATQNTALSDKIDKSVFKRSPSSTDVEAY